MSLHDPVVVSKLEVVGISVEVVTCDEALDCPADVETCERLPELIVELWLREVLNVVIGLVIEVVKEMLVVPVPLSH
jgi:hypothetical protein